MMGRPASTLLVCLLLTFWSAALADEGGANTTSTTTTTPTATTTPTTTTIPTTATTPTTSAVQPCDVGRTACRNANSVSINGNGDDNYRCCQAGFSMSSSSSFDDGRQISSCTCTRGGEGGGGVFISSGSDSNFNSAEFAARMNRWEQKFAEKMAKMQNDLQKSLGNMFHKRFLGR